MKESFESILTLIEEDHTPQERVNRLWSKVNQCTKCPISSKSTGKTYPLTRGTPDAPFLVIGERSGPKEMEKGYPFGGGSEFEIVKNLKTAGLAPWKDVRATNMTLCQVPSTRTPSSLELKNCTWWQDLIETNIPKGIISLGSIPLQILSPSDFSESIIKSNGLEFTWRGIPCIATYNPAYLLRLKHSSENDYREAIEVWGNQIARFVQKTR
jgi:DNA polymerase